MIDVERHRRERLVRLERQVAGLLRYREHSERTLAIAVEVIAGLSGCATGELLYALDEAARPSIVNVLDVLQETTV